MREWICCSSAISVPICLLYCDINSWNNILYLLDWIKFWFYILLAPVLTLEWLCPNPHLLGSSSSPRSYTASECKGISVLIKVLQCNAAVLVQTLPHSKWELWLLEVSSREHLLDSSSHNRTYLDANQQYWWSKSELPCFWLPSPGVELTEYRVAMAADLAPTGLICPHRV